MRALGRAHSRESCADPITSTDTSSPHLFMQCQQDSCITDNSGLPSPLLCVLDVNPNLLSFLMHSLSIAWLRGVRKTPGAPWDSGVYV